MPFTSTQIIITGLAGVATAVGVAVATIQSGAMKQSNPPRAESSASTKNPIAAVARTTPNLGNQNLCKDQPSLQNLPHLNLNQLKPQQFNPR